MGYTLRQSYGLFESFEREYYDMLRSAFLKYSFQVRIGHMDGILVAYHNTRKMFGFQYISREEMDKRVFGSTRMANEAFRNVLVLFHTVLDEATAKYPDKVNPVCARARFCVCVALFSFFFSNGTQAILLQNSHCDCRSMAAQST